MKLPLADWQNFYVIVGSSAGALTGLQFVVITLMAQTKAAGSMREIRAFGTPTVIHFCMALLLSAVMTAPWNALTPLSVVFGVVGALGTVYSLITIWHAVKSTYTPDLEDWLWYTAFPLIANLILIAAAPLILWNTPSALIAVAADSIVFLVLGIHNSWDTVTYIAAGHNRPKPDVVEIKGDAADS